MIKINTSGDYVQLIYVDPVQESVQQELKSDTDAFECSYDSEGKLYLQFGLMRFENPDPTDFIVNDVAVTDAADFISKLNALFTGGGGGGVTIYTGDGSLSADRRVDIAGHDFQIQNTPSFPRFKIVGTATLEETQVFSNDGLGYANLYLKSSSDQGLYEFYLEAFDNVNHIEIEGNAIENQIEYSAGNHVFNGLGDFADDAAAAIGGVPINGLYHTAGAVKIRLS
jgi:hypothetical protein